jgi:hypothetical protein
LPFYLVTTGQGMIVIKKLKKRKKENMYTYTILAPTNAWLLTISPAGERIWGMKACTKENISFTSITLQAIE